MTDLFEQFQGADLERLTECLTAIRKAGLRIDRETDAGVNPNSGNVWVFNPEWAGFVYCTIGFKVGWEWTCCNCGEEYFFDTYEEMDAFAQDQNDKTDWSACEACFETAEV